MTDRGDKKRFIIYPEDRYKIVWNILFTFILFFSVTVTPLKLALEDEFSNKWDSVLMLLDIFFAIDIILSFL